MAVCDSSQCRHLPALVKGAKALRVQKEVTLINRFFKKHRIKAHINTELSTFIRGAFMSYTVILDDGGTISSIENRLREMAEHVSWARGKATPVRLRRLPLSLEVPSATPKPLTPDAGASTLNPFAMLLGQSIGYQGVYDVKLSLLDVEHMLAAGTTGSGKSSLINTILCTLLWNTPPRKLGIVPIDPKNDDLRPYGEMPHTVASAFSKGRVIDVVAAVFAEKERRILLDDTSDLPRLLVIVDEWAELYEDREFLAMMASIMQTGRSLGIHVLAATQLPLAKVIGSMGKAQLTYRLVGRVLSATDSNTASGVPDLGAQYLPGKGSFLLVANGEVERIQAYFLGKLDAQTVGGIQQKWAHEPVTRLLMDQQVEQMALWGNVVVVESDK